MTIEILYFDDCPKVEPLVSRLPALLAAARVSVPVELVKVESERDAQRRRFLGSPTVRVGGRDVEPGADRRHDFALKCRLYRTPDGLTGRPPDDWIIAALAPRPTQGK